MATISDMFLSSHQVINCFISEYIFHFKSLANSCLHYFLLPCLHANFWVKQLLQPVLASIFTIGKTREILSTIVGRTYYRHSTEIRKCKWSLVMHYLLLSSEILNSQTDESDQCECAMSDEADYLHVTCFYTAILFLYIYGSNYSRLLNVYIIICLFLL